VRLDDDQTRIFGARRADVTGVGAWEPPVTAPMTAAVIARRFLFMLRVPVDVP
jgi:hypothetical protein